MKRYFTSYTFRSSFFIPVLLLFSLNMTAQQLVTKDLPQYLLSDFSSAEIKMQQGNNIVLNLNYNTATGKIVFIKSGRMFDLVNPQSVDTIDIQGRVFVPYDSVFLEVEVNGEIGFFTQYMSEISISNKPVMTGTAQVSASNYYPASKSEIVYLNNKLPEGYDVKSSKLFWVRLNGKMMKFTNERQLLRIFPEKADQIKLFIRKSDLKIDNRADMIKIANYCNEIMK